jgi:hypothetical protein
MKNLEFDVQNVICKRAEARQRRLECPVCGCVNSHLESPSLMTGDQNWGGCGELAITPLDSECGCKWELCIGYHKGESLIFTRINKSCRIEKLD